MSIEPIRYGIAGLGRAGWEIHAKQLRDRDDAHIVAVTDPLEDRRRQAEDELGCRAYTQLEDMLCQADLDVVVIATPSAAHAGDTLAALGADKHVVVEKPMGMNVEEADAMISAADQAGRKLFVHHNWRFMREFTYLRGVAQSGLIGELFHIGLHVASYARRFDWQTLARNGGGVLNNTCPHFIDMILQLLGAPVVDVMGDLQQIAAAGDVEDHVKALMRTANGCTADMEISSAQNVAADLPRWILCGSRGTVTCDGKQAVIRWYDAKDVQPIEAVDTAAAGRKYQSDQLPWQEKTVPAVGPDVGGFYDNISAVLLHGAKLYITPESSRQVIEVTARIRAGTKFSGALN
jgi:scyllo-inositol 2-dehydrogenase (NADP+)